MKKLNKKMILLIALVAIMAVGVGGTLAYLIAESGPVTNTFKPVEYDTELEEPGWNNEKKETIVVTNNGEIGVYVRVAIVANWVNGNTVVEPWDGTVIHDNTNWTKIGDYYYYNKLLAPGATTENLLDSPIVKPADREDGATLQVKVIHQSVQQIEGVTGAQATFEKAAE